jgi:D-amino-acid dehydrogenase
LLHSWLWISINDSILRKTNGEKGRLRVAVIGAGITGMFLSYYLRKGGCDVTLIERTTPLAFTSIYNAGYITPSFTSTFPVSFWYLASTMLGPRGAVYISPKQVVTNFTWFRIAMGRALTGFEEKVKQLSTKSLAMYRDFFNQERMDVDVIDRLVGVYKDPEFAKKTVERLNCRYIDGRELQEMGLTNLGGGALVEGELSVNSHKLFRGLRNLLLNDLGVDFRTGNEVEIIAEGRRVTGVGIGNVANDGGREKIDSDAFVVTAGASCKDLLQPLGFDPQILPAIGRVLIFDTGGANIVKMPILLEDYGVTLVQHNKTTVRATSFFELNGFNRGFNSDRKNWLLKIISNHVSNYGKLNLVEEGVGFRPCSPDQLPVIGAVPKFDNLYVASGNCRLGVTLAPATAYIVCSLIAGKDPNDVPWKSFDPSRFLFPP